MAAATQAEEALEGTQAEAVLDIQAEAVQAAWEADTQAVTTVQDIMEDIMEDLHLHHHMEDTMEDLHLHHLEDITVQGEVLPV